MGLIPSCLCWTLHCVQKVCGVRCLCLNLVNHKCDFFFLRCGGQGWGCACTKIFTLTWERSPHSSSRNMHVLAFVRKPAEYFVCTPHAVKHRWRITQKPQKHIYSGNYTGSEIIPRLGDTCSTRGHPVSTSWNPRFSNSGGTDSAGSQECRPEGPELRRSC